MSGLDTIIEGVLLGGVYALFALGLSLIFGIMRLVNLAHGDLILLAAYLVLSATTALGLPLVTASLLVVAAMFVLGFVLQRLRVVDQFRWSPHVEIVADFARS